MASKYVVPWANDAFIALAKMSEQFSSGTKGKLNLTSETVTAAIPTRAAIRIRVGVHSGHRGNLMPSSEIGERLPTYISVMIGASSAPRYMKITR